MEQLIMRWKNDHTDPKRIEMPENCSIVTFPGLDHAVEKWLDIIQYGLTGNRKTPDYYKSAMLSIPEYRDDKCFFILESGVAVATITVICNYKTLEGYIHMVACNDSVRGKGFGNLLGKIAENVLKSEGMETAYLTTDDWRIPAIKSYLKIGFKPDLSTEDFKERWEKIYDKIGLTMERTDSE